eukprot:110305-Hanusia_phi.AAC.4
MHHHRPAVRSQPDQCQVSGGGGPVNRREGVITLRLPEHEIVIQLDRGSRGTIRFSSGCQGKVYEISSDGFRCELVETERGEKGNKSSAEQKEDEREEDLSAWITSLEGRVGFWQTGLFLKDPESGLKTLRAGGWSMELVWPGFNVRARERSGRW